MSPKEASSVPSNYKAESARFIGYYDSEVFFYKIWAIVNRDAGTFMGICGVYRNDGKEHDSHEYVYKLTQAEWTKK